MHSINTLRNTVDYRLVIKRPHQLEAWDPTYLKPARAMAIRGQRFHIDLDSDEETNVPKPTIPATQASPFFGLVSDVKERATSSDVKAPSPPRLKSTKTGFPGHNKRPGLSTFKQRRAHEASTNDSRTKANRPAPTAFLRESSRNGNGPSTASGVEGDPTVETERQRIDEENKQRLAQMSPDDIEEARQELMNGLSPSLIERLVKKANIDDGRTDLDQEPPLASDEAAKTQKKSPSKRVTFEEPEPASLSTSHLTQTHNRPGSSGASSLDTISPPEEEAPPELDPLSPNFLSELHDKYFPELPSDPSKLSWMQPLPETSSYDPSAESLPIAALRFDFRGRLLPPRLSSQLPSTIGLHHHAHAPSSAGYTIQELAHLARSSFPAQRCIAMQTLGRILYRLGRGDFGREGEDLFEGLWKEMGKGRVIDNLVEVAGGDGTKGNRSIWVTATEAVWLWRKGGGRRWQAR